MIWTSKCRWPRVRLRGLADGGERLGQQVVERLAVGEPRRGTRRSRRAARRRSARRSRPRCALTCVGDAVELLDDPPLAGAQQLLDDLHQWDSLAHVSLGGRSTGPAKGSRASRSRPPTRGGHPQVANAGSRLSSLPPRTVVTWRNDPYAVPRLRAHPHRRGRAAARPQQGRRRARSSSSPPTPRACAGPRCRAPTRSRWPRLPRRDRSGLGHAPRRRCGAGLSRMRRDPDGALHGTIDLRPRGGGPRRDRLRPAPGGSRLVGSWPGPSGWSASTGSARVVTASHWYAVRGNFASWRVAWSCGFSHHGTIPQSTPPPTTSGPASTCGAPASGATTSMEPRTPWEDVPVLEAEGHGIRLRPWRDARRRRARAARPARRTTCPHGRARRRHLPRVADDPARADGARVEC